jgi:hypothetical protein
MQVRKNNIPLKNIPYFYFISLLHFTTFYKDLSRSIRKEISTIKAKNGYNMSAGCKTFRDSEQFVDCQPIRR